MAGRTPRNLSKLRRRNADLEFWPKFKASYPQGLAIPGGKVSTDFYNSCDYWCEKCQHAAECPVYKKTRDKGARGHFVGDVKESLDEALAMLHEMAEEFQIDFAEVADDEEEQASRLLNADRLVALSRDFTLKVHKSLNRKRLFVTEDMREFLEDLSWYPGCR